MSLSRESEHWPLFRAIAETFQANGISPQKILEIGTLDGKFTRELSALFPNSLITTIDLPSDRGFGNEYGWENPEAYVLEREKNLRGRRNIKFVEADSLELSTWVERFDLIWVDGDHSLPTVAIDIANALRLVTKNGMVIIDDVFKKTPDPESRLASTGAYRTLENLWRAGIITGYSLVRKRLNPRKNLKWNTKFIAVVRGNGHRGPRGSSLEENPSIVVSSLP